jgi:aconitate hydratase
VIAAITSCTNTSNPSVMLAPGCSPRKLWSAAEAQAVGEDESRARLEGGLGLLSRGGLTPYLEALNFHLVGYGCTTCIGNSGPLPEPVAEAVQKENLTVAAVLSGNRNFEGRINAQVKANYLASPPLVVAYALAGRIDIDLTTEPLGEDSAGAPVYLRDIWPSDEEVRETVRASIRRDMFRHEYEKAFEGDANWQTMPVPSGDIYVWDDEIHLHQAPAVFR